MIPDAAPQNLRDRLRIRAGNRCGYCLARQEYLPWTLEVELMMHLDKSKDQSLSRYRVSNRRFATHHYRE